MAAITAHAEVVGSLLRPPELLAARESWEQGRISTAAFKAVEDRAVDGAVALQEGAGLEVITDGEMRRLSFQSQMTDAVEGFTGQGLDAFLWGDWHGDEEVGGHRHERPTGIGVAGKLKPRRHLAAEEFTYLRGRTGGPPTGGLPTVCIPTVSIPKVCLPSPSLWANFYEPVYEPGVGSVYGSLDAFLADVVDIMKWEVAELARLGATYVQLDAPHYTAMLDPASRAFYEARGWPADHWLERGIELDNAVIDAFPDITFGFHLCRGNQGSRWLVEGAYDSIAAPIFRHIHAQRLLLEYDDERSGSFAPLAEVPEDKVAVLGLVTTKSGRRETPEQLSARILEAATYMPLERLALSPQCGFATSIVGNRISPEDQRRKLATIVETARRVWA